VHEGKWERCPDYCYWDYPLTELAGKTLGIIGYGRIGSKTGAIAAALGMNVVACNDVKGVKPPKLDALFVSFDALLSKSDCIVLHCPATDHTKGIINANTIARMKDGVIIVNNSRGALIVESDLASALAAGKVSAAAVDVLSAEPARTGNPLLQAKNCIITPHISWAPKESRERLMDIAVGNLRAFIAGKPVNVVNK
jgi:glycerate dehydrogenase